MAGMQDVEDAVGEHDAAPGGARVPDEALETGRVERHPWVFLNRMSPVNRQLWRGR